MFFNSREQKENINEGIFHIKKAMG